MNSLKHASRRELLMVLAEMGEENENLTRRLRETEKKLEEKEIKISECGTLAEAALKLNGIFEACDRAAQEYLDNVRIMYPMKEENESAETEEEIRDSKKDA